MTHTNEHRGFSSKLGFMMAAVGSAIGLGNLWAFPYKVGKNGGAAFIFIYIIMALVVGVVAMVGELIIGKRSQLNVVDTFSNITPKSKWVGYLGIIVPFLILCYYPIIGGWSLKYGYDYISGTGVGAPGVTDFSGAFTSFTGSPMAVLFLAIFLAIVFVIVLCGVKKGIEQASKILMPILFVCLLAVIIYGLTLEGAVEGVEFIFKPDFTKVTGQTVIIALGQVFFSMSLGMGINIAYGSYMGKNMKVGQSALLVGVFDTLAAILAGLAIFPALFALGGEPTEGPGLLFIALAKVFANMGPALGRTFGTIFFLLVVLAAVTSCIALLEVPVQFIVEKYHINRKLASVCVAGVAFGIGSFVSLSFGMKSLQVNGQDLLTLIDTVVNTVILPITAFATCILVGWVVKPKCIRGDFHTNNKFTKAVYHIWSALIKFIAPAGIAAILVTQMVDLFTGKISGFGTIEGEWIIMGFAIALLLIAIALNIGASLYEKKHPKVVNATMDSIEAVAEKDAEACEQERLAEANECAKSECAVEATCGEQFDCDNSELNK